MLGALRSSRPATAVVSTPSPPAHLRLARAPRSHLLAVVYVCSLAVLMILGGGLALLVSAHVSSAVIGGSAAADRAMGAHLLRDLGSVSEPLTRAERDRMTATLEERATEIGLLELALLAPSGDLLAGTHRGSSVALPPDARSGRPVAEIISGAKGPRLYEWFPAQLDGRTVAVLQVVRDGGSVLASADAARRDIALAAAGGSTVLILLLFLVFRGAQRRLDAQTAQLLESVRRDPLTGHFTHGAALAQLTESLDAGVEPLAVALVDIDNFRQLNDTHGHDFGDAVIRRVADALDVDRPAEAVIGRAGPDEFVVIVPGSDARSTSAWLADVRRHLTRTGIDTEAGDALPVSLSAGIAVAPLHGRSATELLSAGAMTIGEAKSSGGDQVLVSRLSYADLVESHRASFSILDGLVNAIDARDRYTRHHSEDVARYALYLGRQLGVDRTFASALHQASLLHDVGKIAVPDPVLRKPGTLTDAEMAIMQQHVVLGAALVRDLAAADLVVAGVRHHHERWDGGGYPDGLESDGIPLIARIISVADTFSAMTTTRPYRRALSQRVALQRLSAAAGTQLDPRLVDVFILSMESQPAPPVPSDQRPPVTWLPDEDEAVA